MNCRFGRGRASGDGFVHVIHHDQAVVHDDPGQRDHAQHRDRADGDAENQVTDHRAHDTEGYDAHDDQRLDVGLQRYRHERIDAEQGCEEGITQLH